MAYNHPLFAFRAPPVVSKGSASNKLGSVDLVFRISSSYVMACLRPASSEPFRVIHALAVVVAERLLIAVPNQVHRIDALVRAL